MGSGWLHHRERGIPGQVEATNHQILLLPQQTEYVLPSDVHYAGLCSIYVQLLTSLLETALLTFKLLKK